MDVIECAECGMENTAGSWYCQECGARLSGEAQVRHVMTEQRGSRRRRWPFVLVLVLAALAMFVGLAMGVYTIPPIGALPEGKTLVVWRRSGEPFFNSPDRVCLTAQGGVSLLCRAVALAAAPMDRIIVKLPYVEWIYRKSTGGVHYGGTDVESPELYFPEIEPTKPPGKITVLSVRQGKSTWGRTEVVAQIRNDSERIAGGVRVHAECYRGGQLVATEWMPADPYDLDPGMKVGVSVRFAEGVVCDNVDARATVSYWP